MKHLKTQDQENFIKKLKELREINNWTIKEFSELTEISAGYISDIECGRAANIGKDRFSKMISVLKKNKFSKKDEYEFYSYYLKLIIPKEVYKVMVKEYTQE